MQGRNPSPRLLSELKRRRVLHVAGVYLAGAFLALQGADYLFRALLLPDWTFRLAVLVVMAGFLIAMPLSWIYDLGPDGLRRTPAMETGSEQPLRPGTGHLIRVALLASALLTLTLAGGWFAVRRHTGDVHPRRLVVASFENRTGDAALASLGEMAADWITQGLTESGIVEVADGSPALAVAREASLGHPAPGDLVQRFSRATGAGLVVTGRVYPDGDSIAYLAQVVEARSGRILRAIGPVAAARSAPVEGAERLRRQLLAELAVLLDDRLASYQPLTSGPPTYESYREYIEGTRAAQEDEWQEAAAHYLRAYELDTTFHRALVAAATVAWFGFSDPDYHRVLARADAIRERLAPGDRYRLDLNHAYHAGDMRAAYAAARQINRVEPGSDAALWELALNAGRIRRHGESLALLRRIDAERTLSSWKWYWAYVGGAQHALGDHRAELRSATHLAQRLSGSPVPDAMRLVAVAALGRTAETRALAFALAERLAVDTAGLRELSNVESLGYPAPAAAVPLFLAVRELIGHGDGAAARTLTDEALRWCATRPDAQLQEPAFRWIHAQLLGIAERWTEAGALLTSLDPPALWQPAYAWYSAIVAARLGNRAAALRWGDVIGSTDVMLLAPPHVAIPAALGDREAVLRELRQLAAAGGWSFGDWWLHTEPTLLPYRDDPEVRRVLALEN